MQDDKPVRRGDAGEPLCKLPRTTSSEAVAVETWKSQAQSYYAVNVLLSVNPNVTCAIMHEDMCDVQLDAFPMKWPDSNNEHDCATLPCGHSFHPCALALHFFMSDMRCPVCRAGSEDRLDVHTLPSPIADLLLQKEAAKLETSLQSNVEAPSMQSVQAILSRLLFRVQLRGAGYTGRNPSSLHTIDTHILLDNEALSAAMHAMQADEQREDGLTAHMVTFNLQRSFQRIIRRIIERNGQSAVVFSLMHPFVPIMIAGENAPCSAVCNEMFNRETMTTSNGTLRSACIPLLCSAVAGSEPVAYLISEFDAEQTVPSIRLQINVQMIYNVAVDFLQGVDFLQLASSHLHWNPGLDSMVSVFAHSDGEVFVQSAW